MNIFNFHIEYDVYLLIEKLMDKFYTYIDFNIFIEEKYSILDFIENQNSFEELKKEFTRVNKFTMFDSKVEYGDFQTPESLTDNICRMITENGTKPDLIIEPTSGFGNFIISSLKYFDSVTSIFGIEINSNYVWQTKFNILDYIEKNSLKNLPKIKIFNENIFNFDFKKLNLQRSNNILVLGNPPWVTNTTLSILESDNLPEKSNFKNHSGIDAITGKGNFDISEFITLLLIKNLHDFNVTISFIVKNSVVKNIVFDQAKNKYNLSEIKKINIDAQKEFGVSVDACILQCQINGSCDLFGEEYSFYNNSSKIHFGWYKGNFVSDIDNYKNCLIFDGKSQIIWRSGVKHDCVKVLELQKRNGYYINKLNEEVELEEDLIYYYLKGSYLKDNVINKSSLFTIVTQKKVGDSTDFIKIDLPLTYQYLSNHQEHFDSRKSSIYKNKPDYSIFGIGDYSFKPYKVAIAGLYKKYSVSLVIPDENGKPIMLDDTSYFLGFDNIAPALIVFTILNNEEVIKFVDSLSFNDTKRKYSKELLMRIDLFKITQILSFKTIKKELDVLLPDYSHVVLEKDWIVFINSIKSPETKLVLY